MRARLPHKDNDRGTVHPFFDGSARLLSLPVEDVLYKSIASIDTMKRDCDIGH